MPPPGTGSGKDARGNRSICYGDVRISTSKCKRNNSRIISYSVLMISCDRWSHPPLTIPTGIIYGVADNDRLLVI